MARISSRARPVVAPPRAELTYARAKHLLFTQVAGRAGQVRDVYTGRDFKLSEIGRGSAVPVNTEHAFPRARGVAGTRAEADLFHLFPTESVANRERGELPYGEVEQVDWAEGGAARGRSKAGTAVFEPPDAVKGDLARAVLYVSLTYGLKVPAEEEAALRLWHRADPVSPEERARSEAVSRLQGNRNPLVDAPELVEQVDDF